MQSPIEPGVLETNHVPSEPERGLIKKYIQFRDGEYKVHRIKTLEIREEMLQLQERLDEVERTIRDIRYDIQTHQALLSPARSLPEDIYREIFLWCLASSDRPSYKRGHEKVPLLLSQVCSRWRQIAHSTPRLWTKVLFKYDNEGPNERNCDNLKSWLSRTGALPLSVSCRASTLQATLGSKDVQLFRILQPTFPRWRDLKMTMKCVHPDIQELIRYLNDSGAPNPLLQVSSLEINLSVGMEGTGDDAFQNMRSEYDATLRALGLERNTHLRKLCLGIDGEIFYRNLPSNITEFPIASYLPCERLEVLDLRYRGHYEKPITIRELPGNAVYDLLRHSPNLTQFYADIDDYDRTPFPPSKFVMKHLKHMTLSFPDLFNETDLDFLPSFEFPSMTSLSVRSREQMEDWFVENPGMTSASLSRLIDAVGRSLTSLTLEPGFMMAEDLIATLSKLPRLVQLHLKQMFTETDFEAMETSAVAKWGDDMLNCLTPKAEQESQHSCPNLQYLKWSNNTFFTDRTLANFLLQRSSSPHSPVPMKQVHIDFGRFVEEDIQGDCAALVDAGLDLRLSYAPEQYGRPRKNIWWDLTKRGEIGEFTLLNTLELDDTNPLAFGWE